jgi:hypothetical protein
MYHCQSEHECGTCMVLLRAVRDVLSNTCHARWMGRGRPTAWPPRSTPDLNPLDFYLWGHLRTLVCAAPVDNEEALWMPVRLSATAPESLHGCDGPWWDVSRRALNLVEDILSTYCKCTLSAITHKLNVSGHMLLWIFFLQILRFWTLSTVLFLSKTPSCFYLKQDSVKHNICINVPSSQTFKFFYCLGMLKSCPKFVRTFSYTLHKIRSYWARRFLSYEMTRQANHFVSLALKSQHVWKPKNDVSFLCFIFI